MPGEASLQFLYAEPDTSIDALFLLPGEDDLDYFMTLIGTTPAMMIFDGFAFGNLFPVVSIAENPSSQFFESSNRLTRSLRSSLTRC